MTKSKFALALLAFVFAFLFPSQAFSEEEKDTKGEYEVPSHVLNISKENTFPNSSEDQEVVEPSELTKELTEDLDTAIENPELIKMLNETDLNPSPIAIGYRGMIYLGRWPLNYQSSETNINWEYRQINTNELNNLGGDSNHEMSYSQEAEEEVTGALTSKIANPDQVKTMMLLTSKDKTELPLSYQTVIGKGTKKENSYNVPAKKQATLKAYAPAVSEKGEVTFGEVYIQLKGSGKSIVIKNVTKQGIGAWIPIQDHISFSFNLK
ncbi:YfkD famly protein [Lentibacillus sediminis]|uniref:YfkD famly protein n=1 Tax=Lentibacillus sediminis TaxID=1940529 RepID=UPI000C1C7368|nr:YfkD famly protein [Lentibacillus sediminis]